jgi:hypothetical protein
VRIACGRAAARIVTKEPALQLPAQRVYALVQRELSSPAKGGFPRARRSDEEPALIERGEANRVDRRLEHLFTVLSVALGTELMAATLRSLHSDDAHLRGTALEYLQATLPDGLRIAIWPLLPSTGKPVTAERSRNQIADEIMRTSANLRLDRES